MQPATPMSSELKCAPTFHIGALASTSALITATRLPHQRAAASIVKAMPMTPDSAVNRRACQSPTPNSV